MEELQRAMMEDLQRMVKLRDHDGISTDDGKIIPDKSWQTMMEDLPRMIQQYQPIAAKIENTLATPIGKTIAEKS